MAIKRERERFVLIVLWRYDKWHVLVTFVIICQKLWTSLNHLCLQILSPSGLAGSTQEIFGGVLCRSPGGTALGHPIWKHLDVDGNGMGMGMGGCGAWTPSQTKWIQWIKWRCFYQDQKYVRELELSKNGLYLKIAAFTRKLRISQRIWYIADTPFWLVGKLLLLAFFVWLGCFSAWGNGLCNARAGYNCDPLPWSQTTTCLGPSGVHNSCCYTIELGAIGSGSQNCLCSMNCMALAFGPLGLLHLLQKEEKPRPQGHELFQFVKRDTCSCEEWYIIPELEKLGYTQLCWNPEVQGMVSMFP